MNGQQERTVVVLCVCVCLLLLDHLLYYCILAEDKCLFGSVIMFSRILTGGFRYKCFIQKVWQKYCTGTVGRTATEGLG